MSEMKDWTFLTGDVNWQEYGATWCLQKGRAWWVLRFSNKAEWGDGAQGYCCEVLRVLLDDTAVESKRDALSFVGMSEDDFQELCFEDPKQSELCLLDALVSYGVYAPMDSCESNYPNRARAQARRQADFIMSNDPERKRLLNRSVNKIGTTAREMGKGDLLAGLKRSADKVFKGESVSKEKSILLKMYGAANGQTLGGKVETKLAIAGQLLQGE